MSYSQVLLDVTWDSDIHKYAYVYSIDFFLLHFLWTEVSENTMEYLLVSNCKEMVINDASEVIMSSAVLNFTDSGTASVMMILMGTS